MKKSTRKAQIVYKNSAALEGLPLLMANPEAALPLLSMIGQAQFSIEDLLGKLSRQFVEQLLMMAAVSVAGPKHPGCSTGDLRWHGSQGGVVNVGTSKLRVTRPRLRDRAGEVVLPGYAALARNEDLSRRIADVLTCNVSTRKYTRVMYQCADEMGIARSSVSRHFIKDSAHALEKLMAREFGDTDLVAIYVDGIIVAKHHLIAAIGVDANGVKHMLGLVSGSSENARVVKDLLAGLAERGVDMNLARLWVIDGSKALRSAIEQVCGEAAHVQRCRIHKMRNVTERLPKARAAQTRWVMAQALKGDAEVGIQKLKAHAKHLKAQHPDAAASLLEGLEELFTINRLGVTGELARCLATTNVIESPNSVVRRVGRRVTNYRDVKMAMRWAAAGFLEAEKAFRRLRGHQHIAALIRMMRPAPIQLKKAA
ncbi:IS256 family transposase [Comamonadaceae bacterium]|nr:IS256 family transposase [Comamonadaceae bacterium]